MGDREGTARSTDFGSAVVAGLDELVPRVDDDMFAGTMQFSAPEIWLGAPASRKSDLWSLGAVAYYMLTRSLPYGPRLSAARTRAAKKRSEEHTSELQSLMRISYADFCLKKKKILIVLNSYNIQVHHF